MRAFALLLAALATLPACRPAVARDLFVSNLAGNNQLNGQKERIEGKQGPVATISCALKLAAPGDHIIIANTGKPYREQLSVFGCNLHGSERRPLVISGNGAVLDGTVIARDAAWRHVEGDVFAMTPRRPTRQQLFRDGSPLKKVRLASTVGPASAKGINAALQPLQWAFVSNQIIMRVEKDKLPLAYDLRHCGLQTGITLYNTRHVIIEDFVVQGFHQDGVNAHELVRDCVLRRIECRANGRSGISIGGVSRMRVEQSNFYDNGRTQVRAEGRSKLELQACEVDGGDQTLKYGLRGGLITADGQPVSDEG